MHGATDLLTSNKCHEQTPDNEISTPATFIIAQSTSALHVPAADNALTRRAAISGIAGIASTIILPSNLPAIAMMRHKNNTTNMKIAIESKTKMH